MAYDIISVGDTTLDTFLRIEDAVVNCTIKKEICQLCLNYADKIAVAEIHRLLAGNACNNAVGSARLGMKTAFYTIVGVDATGELLLTTAKKEGVDRKYIVVDKKTPSNASTVLHFQNERTILVYHQPRKYALPACDATQWVYYTSVSKGHEVLNKQIIAFVKKTGARLAYNPGTHQMRAGFDVMAPVLAVCDVVFVNKEEAGRILSAHDVSVGALLKGLHATGAKMVVITDGTAGSYAYDGETMYTMPAFPEPALERTGAGDSFATGCIAGLHYGKALPEALRWGSANANSVVQKIGPQAGLLTLSGMRTSLRKHRDMQARIVKHTL